MQIGIDVGATKIESVLLDDNGAELHRSRKESPKDYKDSIESISNSVNQIEKQFNKMLDPYLVYDGDLEKYARECLWWGRRSERFFV